MITNQKFTFIYTFLASIFAFILFTSNSGGRNDDYTGSPNAGGSTCSSNNGGCHFGGTGGGSIDLVGAPTSYTYGSTYIMNLLINDVDMEKAGFQITAVDEDNNYIGTFTANAGNGSRTTSGFSGLTHHSPKNSSNFPAVGETAAWDIQWTAPSSGSSQVKFYYVGNAATGGDTGGDFIYAASSALIPLPLSLIQFQTKANDDAIELLWTTASEQNIAYFCIEKQDNTNNFIEIAKQYSIGTTSQGATYRYTDRSQNYKNNVLRYRLKIVERDGKVEYSTVQTAKIKQKTAFIYPTMMQKGSATLTIHTFEDADNEVFIFDSTGRLVLQNNLEKGSNTLEVRLNEGFYFLKVGEKIQGISIF